MATEKAPEAPKNAADLLQKLYEDVEGGLEQMIRDIVGGRFKEMYALLKTTQLREKIGSGKTIEKTLETFAAIRADYIKKNPKATDKEIAKLFLPMDILTEEQLRLAA